MAGSFSVAVPTSEVFMERGRGEAVFSVTSKSNRPLLGRLKLTPLGGTSDAWLGVVGELEREFKPNETQQCQVRIGLPAKIAAGKYSFRLDVISVIDPDEDYTEGPGVTFDVQAVPEPTAEFPWGILVAVVVLVLITAATVVWLSSAASRLQDPPAPPVAVPLAPAFDYAPKTGSAELTVTFTDKSTGPVANREWSFGNGEKDTENQNPTHKYLLPGKYEPELVVIDSAGTRSTHKSDEPLIVKLATPVTIGPKDVITEEDRAASSGSYKAATFVWNASPGANCYKVEFQHWNPQSSQWINYASGYYCVQPEDGLTFYNQRNFGIARLWRWRITAMYAPTKPTGLNAESDMQLVRDRSEPSAWLEFLPPNSAQ